MPSVVKSGVKKGKECFHMMFKVVFFNNFPPDIKSDRWLLRISIQRLLSISDVRLR